MRRAVSATIATRNAESSGAKKNRLVLERSWAGGQVRGFVNCTIAYDMMTEALIFSGIILGM